MKYMIAINPTALGKFLTVFYFLFCTPVYLNAATDKFSMADISTHASDGDCWIIIEGKVYDITSYIPYHLAPPDIILTWCGKDATEAFLTKGYGQPHSSTAKQLLKQYYIGEFATD